MLLSYNIYSNNLSQNKSFFHVIIVVLAYTTLVNLLKTPDTLESD
jgi:hypothetical protein